MTTRRDVIKQAPAAALAVAIPVTMANATEPDPTFARIEAHRASRAGYTHARTTEEFEEARQHADALLTTLLTTPPPTLAGAAALLVYLNSKAPEEYDGTLLSDTCECNNDAGAAAWNALEMIAGAIRKLAAAV